MSNRNIIPAMTAAKFANVIAAYEFALHWNRESVCELESALCILREESPLRFSHIMSVLMRKAYILEHSTLLAVDHEGWGLLLSDQGFSVLDYKLAA